MATSKKPRRYKRLWKEIEEWVESNKNLTTKRSIKERLKKPYRKILNSDSDSDTKEYYSFR